MSVSDHCTISISTSLDRHEVLDLLTARGSDDEGLSASSVERLHVSVWPWHTANWPNERIGTLPHLEIGIFGFSKSPEAQQVLSRSDTATYYASRILRLRTNPQVEAGLVTDTIYGAWTFWSPVVTAVVETRLKNEADPGLVERVQLAAHTYLPVIEDCYRQSSIPFERRSFIEGWETKETDQHSLYPLE